MNQCEHIVWTRPGRLSLAELLIDDHSADALERCAEFLDVDLAAVRDAAAHVEPYIRVDGTKVWSLMQLERQLRPDAYGRVRGGYIARRRRRATA